jgi:hypothetical protein
VDVGRHALMRGLATACPIFVRGWSLSYDGHQREAGLQALLGRSPPWARPQPCTTAGLVTIRYCRWRTTTS